MAKKKFTIYRLFDKREPSIIRYVGLTTNFKLRIAQHLLCNGENPKKDAWIQTPGVEVGAEVIAIKWDKMEARICEAYWINQYRNRGMPLTNQFIPALSPRGRGTKPRVRTWKVSLPEDSPVLQDLLDYGNEMGLPLAETSRVVLGQWSRALRGKIAFKTQTPFPLPRHQVARETHNPKDAERERTKARVIRLGSGLNLDDDDE